MSGVCEKCGREYELGCDEAHDCVKYLLDVIDDLKNDIERLEREVEDAQDSASYQYKRAYDAEQDARRAHAEVRNAEEQSTRERLKETHRRIDEEQNRRWNIILKR